MATLPIGLGIASLAMTAIGTGVSFLQSQQQSRSAKEAGEYNARVMESNAEAARQQADFAAQGVKDKRNRVLASQRAAFGNAGLSMEDSATDVGYDTLLSSEMDVLAEKYKGNVAYNRYMQEAAGARMQGNTLSSNYRSQGIGTLLSGGASMLSTGYSMAGGYGTAAKMPGGTNPKVG